MDTILGYVEKIVYRNEENGYTVLVLVVEEDEISCVGTFASINEGEYIKAVGEMTTHNLYGEQFNVQSYEIEMPQDVIGMEKYLGSGAIKGIGQILAHRIVKTFAEDTFRIIEEEPECLVKIKGITEKKAREIAQTFSEKRELREVMMYMQKYGVSPTFSLKMYETYGKSLRTVIENNPYKLAEDISRIGFKMADEIAMKIGIAMDSEYRVSAGIMYVLSEGVANGHTYLPEEKLIQKSCELLNTTNEAVEKIIIELAMQKKIIIKHIGEDTIIYASQYYYMELVVAVRLIELSRNCIDEGKNIEDTISRIESKEQLQLDELQRAAVKEAATNGVLIITGGPGTGKTTTINAIIKYFESQGLDIVLAAPTGRASKKMTEATGYVAQTIHRLLEINAISPDNSQRMIFGRNEENPIEADVVIIDETSMLDIVLMNALLKAIVEGTRLIFVGDVDQLPSVGPGNVLHDMIDSDCLQVVRLNKIYRQEEGSDIVENAHKINKGENIDLTKKSEDFYFIKRENQDTLINTLLLLVSEKLPKFCNCSPFADIQVLSPMRKSQLGVEALNKMLQDRLNPKSSAKKEKEYRQNIFREGDKVMQIKNNYQLPWKTQKAGIVLEEGTGIFNGDMGIITEIDTLLEKVVVEYDDGKIVRYEYTQLDELELAYAVTVHKSQGSEYPIVIIPLLKGVQMLFNRNILYTAVTRAKKMVVIIGSEYIVNYMITNKSEIKRYSGLIDRLIEESNNDIN